MVGRLVVLVFSPQMRDEIRPGVLFTWPNTQVPRPNCRMQTTAVLFCLFIPSSAAFCEEGSVVFKRVWGKNRATPKWVAGSVNGP